jgi:hypothetical protein
LGQSSGVHRAHELQLHEKQLLIGKHLKSFNSYSTLGLP